jgi:hypothetical protein
MRGFVIGLVFLVGLSVSVLSLRPGGLRRQLRFVARRFRLTLVLGGIFFIGSLIIRLAFPDGAVADYGPPVLAIVLAVAFMVLGRDPAPQSTPPARLP